MKTAIKRSVLYSAVLLAPIISMATPNDTALKTVDHISWHNQAQVDTAELLNQAIPKGMASIIFIRQADQDGTQSSTNIAINDRYQTSLQPGGITQAFVCSGANQISAVTTSQKTNDLLQDTQTIAMKANQTYFIQIEVTNNHQDQITLTQLPAQQAKALLVDKTYQSHHISRITPECPDIIEAEPILPIKPVKPIEAIVVPVLEEKVDIEIEVLFDIDQAIIKPQYFNEVADVAKFMNKYSNTNALIEGHTDSTGSVNYNEKLSQRRAQAVKRALIDRYGIAPERLTAVGYGESQPIATNKTAAGRQANRRVVAIVEQQ